MNDKILLQQLDERVPQEHVVSSQNEAANHPDFTHSLHARTWATERTQHIVWELPSEPRFHVSRGGLRGDWQWVRPAAANITFLTLFILALVFWPRPHVPRADAAFSSVPPQTYSPGLQSPASTSRSVVATQETPVYSRSFAYQPVMPASPAFASWPTKAYAGTWGREVAPVSVASVSTVPTSYRVPNYQFAPAAPLAGNTPPMQSPF